MFIVKEQDFEYRMKDSGPKYLMKGPRMNFGLILLKPGQDMKAHHHNVMEENFYLLEGELEVTVDGKPQRLVPGDLLHCEPGESHRLYNPGATAAKLAFMLSPSTDGDKVED